MVGIVVTMYDAIVGQRRQLPGKQAGHHSDEQDT